MRLFVEQPRLHRAVKDYVTREIINLEGHNRITGSRVTAILLNGLILSICGAPVAEGLQSTGLPCLVFSSFIDA